MGGNTHWSFLSHQTLLVQDASKLNQFFESGLPRCLAGLRAALRPCGRAGASGKVLEGPDQVGHVGRQAEVDRWPASGHLWLRDLGRSVGSPTCGRRCPPSWTWLLNFAINAIGVFVGDSKKLPSTPKVIDPPAFLVEEPNTFCPPCRSKILLVL